MLAATPAEGLVFLVLTAPICLWIAFTDMKTMRIPNVAVAAMVILFLIAAPFVLALDALAWRLVQLAFVLAVGFGLNLTGLVGAGDAKFAAAMALYVAPPDASRVLFLFVLMMAAALLTHRLFARMGVVRRIASDWQSWTRRRDFPMGFALGGTQIAYLALVATGS